MSQNAGIVGVLALGSVLRLALFLCTPDLAANLALRQETSTPVSTFLSLKEAVHLQSLARLRGLESGYHYSAGVHHSPLIVASLGQVLKLRRWEVVSALIWTAFDVLSAWALYRTSLAKARSAEQAGDKEKTVGDSVDLAQRRAVKVAGLYLGNPFNIASCLSRSTKPLSSCLTLLAVQQAMEGHAFLSTFILSLAAHTSLYPLLQLAPLILLARRQAGPSRAKLQGGAVGRGGGGALATITAVLGAVAGLGGGTYLAWQMQGRTWQWAYQSWGAIVLLTDLTPNIGLWWYFILEMFDHFRDFFLVTLNVHVLSYVGPFTVKYRNDPLFAITALSGILATFQSYPTVGDAGLFWGLMSLHPEIFPYLRHPLVTALLLTYSTLLLPTFHTLWLGPGSRSGSGNANFFYAITLVWGLGGAAAVLDACWAWGRMQWERERRRVVVVVGGLKGPEEKDRGVALAARAEVVVEGGADGAGSPLRTSARRVVVQL